MLHTEQVEAEEEGLRMKMTALPNAKRVKCYERYEKEMKDPDTYAALGWGLPVGLHHIYLGNWIRAVTDTIVFLVGVAFMFLGMLAFIGGPLILGVIVAEIYCVSRSQIIVQAYNNGILRKLLNSA